MKKLLKICFAMLLFVPVILLLSACTKNFFVKFDYGEGRSTQVTVPGDFKLYEPSVEPRAGYKFLGWYDANDAKWDFENDTIEKSIVLKAKWEINKYNINYNLYGGYFSEEEIKTYTIKDEVRMSQPQKPGYVFCGWYDGENFDKANLVTGISKGSLGDVTLYAKWDMYTSDGYLIVHNAERLRMIDTVPKARLVNDIDLEESEWTPINYNGTFDGAGHKISNFRITLSYENVGFFSSINNAVVENLTICDFYINTEHIFSGSAGGIAGSSYNSKVKNCTVSNADISFSAVYNCYVGGIVGNSTSYYETFDNCSVLSTNILSSCAGSSEYDTAYVGGIVGHDSSFGSMKYCYSEAKLSAISTLEEYVGQLAGYAIATIDYSKMIEENKYIEIKTTDDLLGIKEFYSGYYKLLGNIDFNNAELTPLKLSLSLFDGNNKKISNFKITTPTENAGLFGCLTHSVVKNLEVVNYNIEYSLEYGNIYAAGIVGSSNGGELHNCSANGKINVNTQNGEVYKGTLSAYGGTLKNCYNTTNTVLINNASDLINIQGNNSGFFELTGDIDLGGIEWNPINFYASSVFDGKGYTISNFKITINRTNNALFGYVSNSVIKNVNLTDFEITIVDEDSTTKHIASLVAFSENTNIENCSATGSISFTSLSDGWDNFLIGGLVGVCDNIYNCYSKTDISIESSKCGLAIGGLVGECISVSNSGVDANIIVKSAPGVNVGGLCCRVTNIKQSYYSGSMTINTTNHAYIGGLASYIAEEIKDSYSVIDINVEGENAYIGGLFAYTSGGLGSTIKTTNCYSEGDIVCNVTYYSHVYGVGFSADSSIIITNTFITTNIYSESLNNYSNVGGLAYGGYPGIIPEIINSFVSDEQDVVIAGTSDESGVIYEYGISATTLEILLAIEQVWDPAIWDFPNAGNPTLKGLNID